MEFNEEKVITNIIKIRESKGFTKRKLADELHINEASYGRIESRKIALSYSHLAEIARVFGMSPIDLIAYPDTYVKKEEQGAAPVDAILQIRLKSDKRDQVLNLIFGDNNLEIFNK